MNLTAVLASGRGLWTGKHGVRWSFLLNMPYIVIPVVSAVRFLQQQDSPPDLTNKSPLVSLLFVVCLLSMSMLNAGAVAENWRLSMQIIVKLVLSQVYHTECVHHIRLQHVCHDAARRTGLSAATDPCFNRD